MGTYRETQRQQQPVVPSLFLESVRGKRHIYDTSVAAPQSHVRPLLIWPHRTNLTEISRSISIAISRCSAIDHGVGSFQTQVAFFHRSTVFAVRFFLHRVLHLTWKQQTNNGHCIL